MKKQQSKMIFYFLFLQCQSVDSVVVLPGGGTAKPEYELQLNIVRRMEDFNTMKSDVCLATESNLENANLKMDKANNCAPCILDVDIEKGKSENPNPNDDSVDHLKTNDCFARNLQREISLLMGGKFTQMNNNSELPKFTSRDKFLTERVYDTLTNRSRKYKRSTSFNSRRVVLLFSVLSIMGTIVLIYLTLRMWLIGDRSGNV
ncbi:unnamed protein product [Fraxinus pennsylvanica]|uniref:Uncharacterized protein n=1 Tax=Fraxinus pennsylvanica TaxID=56036 RepID=A0AAD2DNG2_9LAMI|nr:unnamed protein product [Fraxinus pennsylvanica]